MSDFDTKMAEARDFFQAQKFAAAHGLDLELKPVLPMVMRGMAVPQAKRIYILTDSKREAEKFGLEFGCIVDPLGPGIEHLRAIIRIATFRILPDHRPWRAHHGKQIQIRPPHRGSLQRRVWIQRP